MNLRDPFLLGTFHTQNIFKSKFDKFISCEPIHMKQFLKFPFLAFRHKYFFQTFTFIEGIIAYACHAIWQHNLFQRNTFTKNLLSNCHQCIG